MHIHLVFVLVLVIACAFVHAQRNDCNRIHKACVECRGPPADTSALNTLCRRTTSQQWIWQDQSQCDIQRLSCQNPCQRLDCENIARLANMRRRRS